MTCGHSEADGRKETPLLPLRDALDKISLEAAEYVLRVFPENWTNAMAKAKRLPNSSLEFLRRHATYCVRCKRYAQAQRGGDVEAGSCFRPVTFSEVTSRTASSPAPA
jgi:hypothetical protein